MKKDIFSYHLNAMVLIALITVLTISGLTSDAFSPKAEVSQTELFVDAEDNISSNTFQHFLKVNLFSPGPSALFGEVRMSHIQALHHSMLFRNKCYHSRYFINMAKYRLQKQLIKPYFTLPLETPFA